MSIYQRPPRSDELMHWGHGRFHKYIEKIGNRYFYTQEELNAYKRAGQEGIAKSQEHKQTAKQLRGKAIRDRAYAKTIYKQHQKTQGKANAKALTDWVWDKSARDNGKTQAEANRLYNRSRGLQRTADANDRVAKEHDKQAVKAIEDAKKKQDRMIGNKSLLTQMLFKRAVEKDDRRREAIKKRNERRRKREQGRQKVLKIFREKGWIL